MGCYYQAQVNSSFKPLRPLRGGSSFRQKQIKYRGHTCFKMSVSYDDARHLSLFVTTCESDVVTPETKKCNPLIHAILFKV